MLALIQALHIVAMAAYLSAPIVALALDVRYLRRRGRKAPSPQYVATACAGIALGTSVSVGFATFALARGSVGQAALASYFAMSLLFILKGFDRILRNGLLMAICKRRWLLLPASALRILLLFGVGLPYIMAAGLTYRPKVLTDDTPASHFGVGFQNVSFDATDGTHLAGWWVPAITGTTGGTGRHVTGSTVVICHGTGLGKQSALPLLAGFTPHGFNVLMFDFRGHGASGGQLVSFGDKERGDVLGAVAWLLHTHAKEARKIYGVGIETGGAALIGAAADRGQAGQAIRAIAVYGCFDNLAELARSLANQRFLPPFNGLFGRVGLVMANVQTGMDLTDFSPGREIVHLWPRPVFVVGGSSDTYFPMEMSHDLYESASEPKTSRWVDGANTTELMSDTGTSNAVRSFFETAEPMPVI